MNNIGLFWTDGRISIYRYCDGVFELQCDNVKVMPYDTFERVMQYLNLEFKCWWKE